MTTDTQKEIEIHYAKNTASGLGEEWEIRSPPNEQEWPDLIVMAKGKEFGLEVREIYRDESRKGSIKKATETLNIQKLQAIAAKYYQFSDVSIRVKLFGPIESEDLILKSLNSISSELLDFKQIRLGPYPGCILYVTKAPSSLRKYTEWVYVSDRVGYVGELSDNLIQEKINEKSSNLDRYTKNINDVRLLLVCNAAFNSGRFDYSQSGEIDHMGFKEIYFLSTPYMACKLSS